MPSSPATGGGSSARSRRRTGGAGIAALILVVLQLAGAFDLSPGLVSGITAAVALVGAFAAGWSTRERKPSLPSAAVQSLLDGARM